MFSLIGATGMSVAGHGSQISQASIIRTAVLTDIEPFLTAFEKLVLPLIRTQRMPKTRRTSQIHHRRKLGTAVFTEMSGHFLNILLQNSSIVIDFKIEF
jgi:hypothetical protein